MSFILSNDGMVIVKNTQVLMRDKVALREWRERWPNFPPYELDSDDYSLVISAKALDALQEMRRLYGRPIRVTSAYRNPKHNARVGGVENSSHTKGLAFDLVALTPEDGHQLEDLALSVGFTSVGRYGTRGFIHIDMRPQKYAGYVRRWGRRWSMAA